MARFNIHFSLLAFAVCLGFAQEAIAAPSVKRLGGGSIYTGTSSATAAKSGTNVNSNGTSGRASSVRTIGMGGKIRPTTVTTGTTNNANISRLSVGKYLHNSGVSAGIIKPASSGSGTPSTAGLDALTEDLNALTIRVDGLESQIVNKVDNTALENNYVTKTEIQNNYYTQTTVDEKIDAAKQDAITEITNNVETIVINKVNEIVPGKVEEKVEEYLNSQATVGKPDWTPTIFD